MIGDSYKNIGIADDYSVFEFFSIGYRGVILKSISFSLTEYENIVSLAFGDINIDGEIDTYNITNNGDRDKVLATVCEAINLYLKKYPERMLYFKGSTEERTRL